MGTIDSISEECSKHDKCSKSCQFYDTCLAKFNKNKLTMEQNNPSMMQYEINGFQLYHEKGENTQENFRVNICEVPRDLIIKSYISLYNFTEDIEIKNIMKAALDKFYTQDPSDEDTIIKLDESKYHFIYDCPDCNGLNDFTDYANGDEVSFYCRYCGKKHQFNLANAIDKKKGDNSDAK